jgi:hypothetical protein
MPQQIADSIGQWSKASENSQQHQPMVSGLSE